MCLLAWNSDDESDEIILAKRHYTRAEVDGKDIYDLGDDAHVYVRALSCILLFQLLRYICYLGDNLP